MPWTGRVGADSSGADREDRQVPLAALVDLADGVAAYDESFWHERPDWTYDPL